MFDRSFLIIPQHVTARKIIPKRWLVSDLGKSLNCFIIFGTNEQRLPQAEPLNPEQKETRNRSESPYKFVHINTVPEAEFHPPVHSDTSYEADALHPSHQGWTAKTIVIKTITKP